MITAETVSGIARFQANGPLDQSGPARQIATDLMPEEYPTAAKLRFPLPPPQDSQP
jgi:hypothetical protein